MKLSKLHTILAILALALVPAACGDDNEDDWEDNSGSKVELPRHRMYILNEGSASSNNAGVAFYAPTSNVAPINDIFFTQNGRRLGDVGQAMIEHNSSVYIAVSGSNYLVRCNSAMVEMDRVSFANEPDLTGGIRDITAEGEYIYASFYGGWVVKINARTLDIAGKLNTGGACLEGITAEDGTLYVANAYSMSPNPTTGYNDYNYLTEIITVNLRNFTKGQSITVAQNPNVLLEADDKIFVISYDYTAEGYVLQSIDPKRNNTVTRIGYANYMAEEDGILYLIDSRTNYTTWTTTNNFWSYDINRGTVRSSSFLQNAPAELTNSSIYMLAIDDETGDFYVGTTHYNQANGEMYRFRANGQYLEKFDCGGQNPRAAVFFD